MAGAAIYVWGPRKKSMAATIPNAEVKLGDFIDYVELRGDIAVRSSKVILAPYNAGDLQILKIVQSGSSVKKGDVVVQFDPTSLRAQRGPVSRDVKSGGGGNRSRQCPAATIG